MKILIIYVVVFGSFCVTQFNAQEVGAACQAARTGAPGTCKIINECQPVIDDIVKRGLFPNQCGFVNYDQVVCCPDPPKVTTTPRPSNRLSARKCKEYEDAVYERVSIYQGVGQPPYVKKVLKCSTSNVPLVVGGEAANPKEFPHMALLGYQPNPEDEIKWQCGGSLISDNFILTAAHCTVTNRFTGPVKYALLGDYDLDRTNDDAQPLRVDVSETIAHPQFKRTSKYFDIALVKLARRITFNQYIRPACLPETYETGTSKAIASGWGRTSARSEGSNVLMKVVLEIFNEEECNATYRVEATTSQLINGIIPDSQFCAGHHTEKKDTCQGDSGGPLQIYHPYNKCMYTISGVTSFGKLCGELNAPGVYTRVYAYLDWIEGHVWPY